MLAFVAMPLYAQEEDVVAVEDNQIVAEDVVAEDANGVEEMDDKQLVQYLYSIKDNDSFNNDQKAALFAYASRLKQQQGANTADMLMRMEGNLTKES